MIGFVLTGHGNFSLGLKSAVDMVAGDTPAFKAVPFDGTSTDTYAADLRAAISELHARNPQTVGEFPGLIRDLAAQGHLKGIRASDEAVYIAFPLTDDETARDAFQKLGARIFRFAKAAKRVQPDFQKPEAEKYHMRGWLLRLGLGGPAHAAVRKVLLGHLAGCSAFPNAEQARRHAEKYAAIRREQRAAVQAAEAPAATQPIQEPLDAGETVPAESPENPSVKEVKAID